MATDAIGAIDKTATAVQTTSDQTSIMGKEDFLMLLVAQLENQDPLDPMDNTEFVAQLATFSSLEQLQNVNTGLDQLQASQKVMNQGQAVSYIGKQVKAAGSAIQLTDGQADPISFSLSADAAGVFVSIYDEAGNYVTSIEQGAMSAGDNEITWDGHDVNGELVSDGVYTFEIVAVDAEGNAVTSEGKSVSGKVTGVTYQKGVPYLMVNDQAVALSDIVEVSAEQDVDTATAATSASKAASDALDSILTDKTEQTSSGSIGTP